SSSTNRIRRLLRGDALKQFLLGYFRWIKRQTHCEGASLIRPGAGRFNLASVLCYNAMADRQTESRAFSRSASRKERLKDVLQNFRRHSATGIHEHQFCHAISLAQGNPQSPALLHALQAVDNEIEHHGIDLLCV